MDPMCFRFETPDIAELERLGFVFAVDGTKITDQLDIFKVYGEGLKAPNGYFGENWNAFNDCLLDLDWIKAQDIFIIHRELPLLSHDDMENYLDILQHVIRTWADEKTDELHRLYPDFVPHRLTVFFSKDSESEISAYLEKVTPPSSAV
jgi:hypothetical protein